MLLLIASAGNDAQLCFLDFFAAAIRNPHMRRAYARGCGDLLSGYDEVGVTALPRITPLHVATWVEQLCAELSVPTVNERLAGVRHLFDWLIRYPCQTGSRT